YMATAVERGDNRAAICAILTMLAVIIASDQLIWRPLLAWADKFKIELIESAEAPQSWLYSFLRRAYIFPWIEEHIFYPISDGFTRLKRGLKLFEAFSQRSRNLLGRVLLGLVGGLIGLWVAYEVVLGIVAAIDTVYNHVTVPQFAQLFFLGLLTMGRVALMTIVATLIWTPIGVWIGFKPKIARLAQPLAQIA